MNINKHKIRIIGAYTLVSFIFSYNGLSQSHSIIDIDKARILELPVTENEDPFPDDMLSFNDIIKVKTGSLIPYIVDYIPVYQPPIISKGNIFINLDNKRSVYDLESVNEFTDVNNLHNYEYIVNEYSKKEHTVNDIYKSMFGEHPSKVVNYLVSVDASTGDTLWKKKGRYLTVRQANKLSLIGNYIIDNKTGEELFKLSSSKPINISEIKEDNGYLYLRKSDEIIAIDLQKGKVLWRVKGDFNNFFMDDTRIYTSNQCAIDKKTGKLIWNNSSEIWFVGIVGNYLIGYLYMGEDDPEIYAYDKSTGKLAGYIWSDKDFCTSCLGYESCFPKFVFAEQGEGNKTAALIKCSDGVYLYTFEVVE